MGRPEYQRARPDPAVSGVAKECAELAQMVQFSEEPSVWVYETSVTITLRVVDDTTDVAWRTLFNELAEKEPNLEAEAMGSRSGNVDRTVLQVKLPRRTSQQATVDALEAARRVAKRTTEKLPDRRRAEVEMATASKKWWEEIRNERPPPTFS
jgi:hypothetical protein